jgi:hypothetical protein
MDYLEDTWPHSSRDLERERLRYDMALTFHQKLQKLEELHDILKKSRVFILSIEQIEEQYRRNSAIKVLAF